MVLANAEIQDDESTERSAAEFSEGYGNDLISQKLK